MVDFLIGGDETGFSQVIATRVVVTVVIGEVAARDLQPDAMAFDESAGCRAELDPELRDLSWRKEVLSVEAVSVPGADHPVADEDVVELHA